MRGTGTEQAVVKEQDTHGNTGSLTDKQSVRPTTGKKQDLAHLTKAVIVAAQTKDDTDWVSSDLPRGWEHIVMIVDDQSAPNHTPVNKGREAGAYLWYLIQHYDTLPDTMVFLHSHRDGYPRAWHTDNEAYSNPLSIKRLRIASVQKRGFVNLRCLLSPGCPADLQLHRDPPDLGLTHELAMPEALQAMFGMSLLDMPPVLAAPCCSQFAVSRTQVRLRPREDYQRFWQWLVDTRLDDATSGRVFEYLWHFIFGKDPVYCPEAWVCYCENYGIWCVEDELDDALEV